MVNCNNNLNNWNNLFRSIIKSQCWDRYKSQLNYLAAHWNSAKCVFFRAHQNPLNSLHDVSQFVIGLNCVWKGVCGYTIVCSIRCVRPQYCIDEIIFFGLYDEHSIKKKIFFSFFYWISSLEYKSCIVVSKEQKISNSQSCAPELPSSVKCYVQQKTLHQNVYVCTLHSVGGASFYCI